MEIRNELACIARESKPRERKPLQPGWQARRRGRQCGSLEERWERIHGIHTQLRKQDETIDKAVGKDPGTLAHDEAKTRDLCDGIPASTNPLQTLNERSRLGLGGGRRRCTLRTTTGPHHRPGLGQGSGAELLDGSIIPEGVLEEAVDRRSAEIQANMEDAPPFNPLMDEDMREAPEQAATPRAGGP